MVKLNYISRKTSNIPLRIVMPVTSPKRNSFKTSKFPYTLDFNKIPIKDNMFL